MSLTLEMAQSIINAAIAAARDLNLGVSVSVVDSGGYPIASARMDRASIMTAGVAENKAFTSAVSRQPTEILAKMMGGTPGPNGPPQVGGRALLLAPGGVPIILDGRHVGAVGVSGGPPLSDIACASAGLQSIGAA